MPVSKVQLPKLIAKEMPNPYKKSLADSFMNLLSSKSDPVPPQLAQKTLDVASE